MDNLKEVKWIEKILAVALLVVLVVISAANLVTYSGSTSIQDKQIKYGTDGPFFIASGGYAHRMIKTDLSKIENAQAVAVVNAGGSWYVATHVIRYIDGTLWVGVYNSGPDLAGVYVDWLVIGE